MAIHFDDTAGELLKAVGLEIEAVRQHKKRGRIFMIYHKMRGISEDNGQSRDDTFVGTS